jgi:hypothetical protein
MEGGCRKLNSFIENTICDTLQNLKLAEKIY